VEIEAGNAVESEEIKVNCAGGSYVPERQNNLQKNTHADHSHVDFFLIHLV
jgi:hypothetical protein